MPKPVDTRSHCMPSTIPCSGFLYLQFLARCHPYILFHFLINDFYTCFTHFSLTVAYPQHRGLPRISGYRSRVPYIDCALDISISENTHARNPTRDSRNGVTYCGNFPSERYKLSVCITEDHVRPVSKLLCIIFMACSCPNFVLGRLKKKKMEKIAVFSFSVYNSSDVF